MIKLKIKKKMRIRINKIIYNNLKIKQTQNFIKNIIFILYN